jgi:murein DD-endopeptidase MepM/ murein hydrolase activator NlpD
MKQKFLLRVVSVLLASCLFLTINGGLSVTLAADSAPLTLDEQKAVIEQKLQEADEKLNELGKESQETEEYINALDEKLKYLKQQLGLAQSEYTTVERQVTDLEKKISQNEDDIAKATVDIEQMSAEVDRLNQEFDDTYNLFCKRMRAIYIGGTTSQIELLLQSEDISSLLTRYEMISSVSDNDKALLDKVNNETEEIVEAKNKLDKKKQILTNNQIVLKEDKESLKIRKSELLQKQEDMAEKQEIVEQQQQTANELLKNLNDKTKEYGEYRDITQQELDEIDSAIALADQKYAETETTTEAETTTQKPTTTKPTTTKDSDQPTKETEKQTTTTTTTEPTTKKESQYISLTYPCPAYTTITCGFGAYSGHSGCDFSTRGNENQKIVAAESGTVIVSTDLYDSDGNYRSYGRYIVIRHDKTTSSGQTVYTLYAHNNSRVVYEGQHVKKGELIAYSGSTGNSTGPHCHFEVRIGGSSQSNAVNPAYYLP